MAIQYKCDRCKENIPGVWIPRYTLRVLPRTVSPAELDLGMGDQFDLCPECEKWLGLFLSGKPVLL